MLQTILSAIAALVGATLGSILPHLLEQRRAAKARYDAAIDAVTKLQADRWRGRLTIPKKHLQPIDNETYKRIIQDLSTKNVEQFVESAASCRATLAALHPYSPDLIAYWDKFEISESELNELVDTLIKRRRRPRRRHSSVRTTQPQGDTG